MTDRQLTQLYGKYDVRYKEWTRDRRCQLVKEGWCYRHRRFRRPIDLFRHIAELPPDAVLLQICGWDIKELRQWLKTKGVEKLAAPSRR